jgi:hypothetical protein
MMFMVHHVDVRLEFRTSFLFKFFYVLHVIVLVYNKNNNDVPDTVLLYWH